MGKKKNKINKITEEQYYAYVAGLKNDAALVDANGKLIVPEPFNRNKTEEKQGE
ncbi:MAG: hypothetical protein K2L42_01515 [Clostridia bacterium]|nr:hypothetical protein [Clostridia bacterium]